jgi:serine/threonine-protein kinase
VGPDDRIPVGLRVRDRYRILSKLGTGAFGSVYRTEDEATGHEVAIRLLPPGLAGAPHGAHPIESAGRSILAASTAHPALAHVLELGKVDNGQAFVAMELAKGHRLNEVLSAGPLDVGTALRLAIELGEALETLHNTGFVHGAVRPRNVMVREDEHVTLMDVELAGLRAAQAVTGLIADEEPPEYLSPEQIRRGPVTEKTDIYAFAVVLYEMLCGVPPFWAVTRETVLEKHLTETPTPMRRRRRGVPASVEAVVARALAKQPERRPPMGNVLNDLWVEAHRPATRWRQTAAMLGGAGLAASIAGGVVWGLVAPQLSAPPSVEQRAPRPAVRQAPVSGSPVSSPPAPQTPPAPTRETVKPTTVPSSTARATPPSAAPTPAPRPSRAERPEPSRKPQTPPASADQRPAAPSNADDPDPGLVVDWLLERAAGRSQ